jgi:hypothetical protein
MYAFLFLLALCMTGAFIAMALAWLWLWTQAQPRISWRGPASIPGVLPDLEIRHDAQHQKAPKTKKVW